MSFRFPYIEPPHASRAPSIMVVAAVDGRWGTAVKCSRDRGSQGIEPVRNGRHDDNAGQSLPDLNKQTWRERTGYFAG
jgi:hypothetical protein